MDDDDLLDLEENEEESVVTESDTDSLEEANAKAETDVVVATDLVEQEVLHDDTDKPEVTLGGELPEVKAESVEDVKDEQELADGNTLVELSADGEETADVQCECKKADAAVCDQPDGDQSERERCRKMAELLMSKKNERKEEEPKVVCRQKNPKLTYWLSALSFLLLICIGAGLYALYVRIEARNQAIEKLEQQIDERKQALSKPVVADIDSVQPVEKVGKKEPVVEPKQHVHTGVTDYNYDARVRTGAYVIVGIDQVVTVQKGQTLASISKAFLGDGMECYVEVLNKRTEVKPGETLKIPKLKLKKRIGKNN